VILYSRNHALLVMLAPTPPTDLASTFMRIDEAFDGEQMTESSVWAVQISDVPVNMTEAYATRGKTRCYRMLQVWYIYIYIYIYMYICIYIYIYIYALLPHAAGMVMRSTIHKYT